jgi:hypothetical protein
MVAANLTNVRKGGDRKSENQTANLRFDPVTVSNAAKKLNVSPRSVDTAAKVKREATPEQVKAIEQGKTTLNAVAKTLGQKPILAVTPAKPAEPERRFDRWGHEIQPEILEAWDKATDWITPRAKMLKDMRLEIVELLSKSDPDFKKLAGNITLEIKKAEYSLKLSLPYTVCPSCAGRDPSRCNGCQGTGWLSKFTWDIPGTATPILRRMWEKPR